MQALRQRAQDDYRASEARFEKIEKMEDREEDNDGEGMWAGIQQLPVTQQNSQELACRVAMLGGNASCECGS